MSTLDTTTLRAAGYIRVSTEEQVKHGWNLDADKDRIEAIAAEQGWELIQIHDDGGRQGDDPDRPGFNQLLDTLDRVDVIVMRSLDRLSRDTFLYALATRAIRAAGVQVYTFSGLVDLETPEGELAANVLAAIHRFEKRQIGARVAQAARARVKAGHNHGRAAYAYRSEDGLLIVVEHEAAVVRRIFSEFADQGLSQRTICRRLNRDGIVTQRGGHWTQGTVSKVLSNPVYIGIVRAKGIEAEGLHEAIIDPETWRRAEQLRAATKRSDGGKGRSPIAGHVLAGGLLRCRCGSAMNAITKPTRTPQVMYEAYSCSGRAKHGTAHCDQPVVKRGPIDSAIWEFFSSVALDIEATRTAITEHHTGKLAELDALAHQAAHDAQQAEARLTRVRRAFQDGYLEADDWNHQRTELADELEAARAQVQRLAEQRDQLITEAEQIDTESAVLIELNALRAMIVGEAREGERQGIEAFRAALRRTFTHFELVPHGFPRSDGEPWQGECPTADGYTLIPYLAADALDLDSAAFPALRRASLSLSGRDSKTLTTASDPLSSLFGPIRVPGEQRRTEKACSRCRVVLPLSEFNRERRSRDGHRADCRRCQHVAAKAIYEATRAAPR